MLWLRVFVEGVVIVGLALSVAGSGLSAQQTPRITVTWTEAPIHDVLHAFAVFSGRSIVSGSGVAGAFVTADIRDKPWDVALRAILHASGLSAEEDEYGIIRVEAMADLDSREGIEPIVTRAYRLSFARAAELQATIAPLLSDRGSVGVLEGANVLVVSDIARVHSALAMLLGS